MINLRAMMRILIAFFVFLGLTGIVFRSNILPFWNRTAIQTIGLPDQCFGVSVQSTDENIINQFKTLEIEYVEVDISGLFMKGLSSLVTEENTVSIHNVQFGTFDIVTNDNVLRGLLDLDGRLWTFPSKSNRSIPVEYVSIQLTDNERISSVISFPNGQCFAVITGLRAEFWDSETLEHLVTLDSDGIIAADIDPTGTLLAYTSGDNDSNGPARVTILDLQRASENTLYFDEPLAYIQYCNKGQLCAVTNDGNICTFLQNLEYDCYEHELFDSLIDVTSYEFVDNSLLFSSQLGDIVLVDLETGEIKETIVSNTDPIQLDFQDSVLTIYSPS